MICLKQGVLFKRSSESSRRRAQDRKAPAELRELKVQLKELAPPMQTLQMERISYS
jgi:hypothetical protein